MGRWMGKPQKQRRVPIAAGTIIAVLFPEMAFPTILITLALLPVVD